MNYLPLLKRKKITHDMNLELGLELGSGLGLGVGLVSSLRGNVLRCRAPTVVNWNNCDDVTYRPSTLSI